MKLIYHILWFDDTEEVFDSLSFDPLEEMFSELGFNVAYKLVTTPESFANEAPYKKYDLIVVDYNLEEYDSHGQDFIEEVRGHQIFTEVIFYSNKPTTELWSAIYEKRLEGIFVTNREGIINKIINVSKQSVEKVLDVENMRGIVMAEIGDIDLMLDEIISSGINTLDEKKKREVFSRFHSRAKQQADGHMESLNEFLGNPTLEGLIEHCDSYKRWITFKSIVKRHQALKEIELDDYNEEILKPRNYLAHGKYKALDNGDYVFEYKGDEFVVNEQVSRELRIRIMKYKRLFEEIVQKL